MGILAKQTFIMTIYILHSDLFTEYNYAIKFVHNII